MLIIKHQNTNYLSCFTVKHSVCVLTMQNQCDVMVSSPCAVQGCACVNPSMSELCIFDLQCSIRESQQVGSAPYRATKFVPLQIGLWLTNR